MQFALSESGGAVRHEFIECAKDAGCIYIVSGDKDLLSIVRYQDIQILTVAQFLAGMNQ